MHGTGIPGVEGSEFSQYEGPVVEGRLTLGVEIDLRRLSPGFEPLQGPVWKVNADLGYRNTANRAA